MRSFCGFLAHPFSGVEELRAQSGQATASTGAARSTCTSPTASRPRVRRRRYVEATVVDSGGRPVGGPILFVADGRLDRLEVYCLEDPLPLPPVAHVRWSAP